MVGTGSGTQDYGFRIYNPALGRFLSIDPLTKDYPWYTPYQFAGNKPIKCSDVDGAEENDQSTYVYKVKPAITNLDANTIYKLKQEKLHMMVDEYAKKLLETKGISIDPSALFNSFVKVLEKADAAVAGNGGTMKGGLEQYAPTNGGPGTKMTTSNRDVKSINIDYMLAYMGAALKSPMKAGDSNPLNPATIIGDGASVAQEVADMKDDNQAPPNDDDSIIQEIHTYYQYGKIDTSFLKAKNKDEAWEGKGRNVSKAEKVKTEGK